MNTTTENGVTEQNVRATLNDLAGRLGFGVSTIRSLCAFYGLDPGEFLSALRETPAAPRPKRINGAPRPPKAKPPKPPKTGTPARPTQAPTGMQDRILTALKAAGTPVSPRALAKALKLSRAGLGYHVRSLVKSGRVVAAGTTLDRLLSLP